MIGKNRLHSLDSLRGLAAIYVVFFHLLLVPVPNPIIPWLIASRIVLFGGTGVFLFFIISGFSLTLTMPSYDRAQQPLVNYWIRRLFRIAPTFYVMIGVSMLRDQWYFGAHASIPGVGANMLFLFNLWPGHQEGIVWASWTIGVEMLFYLAFPFIYWHLGTRGQVGLAVLVYAGFEATCQLAPGYMYWSIIGYLPLFVIGMLSFKAYTRLQAERNPWSHGLVLSVVGLLVLVSCMSIAGAEKNIHLRVPIGIGYAAVVVGCLLLKPWWLEHRLPFFGMISYSLYLVHAPLLYSLSPVFHAISTSLPASVSYLACAILAFAVTIPVAWIVYRTIEKPADDYGRQLTRRIDQARRHPTTLPT